jgi:hypothetical protein
LDGGGRHGLLQSIQDIGDPDPHRSRDLIGVASIAAARDLSAVSLETEGNADVRLVLHATSLRQPLPVSREHNQSVGRVTDTSTLSGLG